MRVILLVVSLLGCSGPRRTSSPPPPPSPVACPTSLSPPPSGHCTLGTSCPLATGTCFCDGYHGGIPPRENVDYSHWVCGKTTGRSDGCPDSIVIGAACNPPDKTCHPQEGMWCGPQATCTKGIWTRGVDTCSTIP